MGEVEVIGNNVGGIPVHTGSRVQAQAGPGEVLVSSTVRDLVEGLAFGFEDRGVHPLKGVPGEWRLYSVTRLPEDLAEPLAGRRLSGLSRSRRAILAGAQTVSPPRRPKVDQGS
jgi:class 3 adenylate cyclase